jgi:hypothetical protein
MMIAVDMHNPFEKLEMSKESWAIWGSQWMLLIYSKYCAF